jgi:uncharacterized protein (TIGR03435 family)
MGDLARFLGIFSGGCPVRDKTGLTGSYDFTLQPIDDEPARGGDPIPSTTTLVHPAA